MTSEKLCRHEFVRIFQRKLKGLERRLVATKAYLPVGFKTTDFAHLSEGSYCFCSGCRARLYPKRTQAEKAQARLAHALGKQQAELEHAYDTSEDSAVEQSDIVAVHVEELELESVDLQDLEETKVGIPLDEESCVLTNEDEV